MSTLPLVTRLNIPPLSANLVPGPHLIERPCSALPTRGDFTLRWGGFPRTRDDFSRALRLFSALDRLWQGDADKTRPVRRGLRQDPSHVDTG